MSYALVATAFAALALTGELDGLSAVLFGAALSVSFYRDSLEIRRLSLREWMWRALSIAYIPFIFIDAAYFSNRVLALTHMTLFVSAAKLFQNKRDRDWVFLYLLALFQMLLAAALTFNATFIASLGIFLFFFISTLAAFEIRRARREVLTTGEEILSWTRRRRWPASRSSAQSPAANMLTRVRYLLGASAAQVMMIAALTLPFFFLIPRFGGGGVVRGFGEGQAMTGFSDSVELGKLAQIKLNKQIIMRVQLNRVPPKYLRWRGIALDKYERGNWSVSYKGRTRGSNQGSNLSDPHFEYTYPLLMEQKELEAAQRGSVLEQHILLEPLDTSTLFAAQKAFHLRGPIANLLIDKESQSLSATGVKGRLAYSVLSDISGPSEQDLRSDSSGLYPDVVQQLYLQLPKRLDPRIARQAHEWTRGESTPYEQAKAIERHLKTEFGYTLDLKPAVDDPLAEFLFEWREGHCEYFASAMTIMLRTLKIPARLVNGFQMGEYNDINNLYTVRASDAHSWVEVYFPRSHAWVEFDPTPAAGINDYSRGGVLSDLRKFMDAAELFWLNYVVTLDSDTQASIMVDVQHRLLAIKAWAITQYMAIRTWLLNLVASLIAERGGRLGDPVRLAVALGVLLSAILALGAALYLRGRLNHSFYGSGWRRFLVWPAWRYRRFAQLDHRASAVLFYQQMLSLAGGAGLLRQPDETPLEFAAHTQYGEIREITDLYNRVRFGGQRLDEAEMRRVSRLLADFKANLLKRRPAAHNWLQRLFLRRRRL